MAGERTLRAFSIKSGREMWAATVDAAYDQLELTRLAPVYGPLMAGLNTTEARSRDRPMITDLDVDGRWEIIVPDAGPMPPAAGYRGVRMIDGLSGATRWRLPMWPAAKNVAGGLTDVVVGPDLDGDGVREVVSVSVIIAEGDAWGIYVDAASGKDGRRLWWWKVDPAEGFSHIWIPKMVGPRAGRLAASGVADGGEIPLERFGFPREETPAQPVVHLLEASTGRERHKLMGLGSARFADLDGDGLVDLWGDADGELRAFRGEAPEAWRLWAALARRFRREHRGDRREPGDGLRWRRRCRHAERRL